MVSSYLGLGSVLLAPSTSLSSVNRSSTATFSSAARSVSLGRGFGTGSWDAVVTGLPWVLMTKC